MSLNCKLWFENAYSLRNERKNVLKGVDPFYTHMKAGAFQTFVNFVWKDILD
jgi:hypothetical protein